MVPNTTPTPEQIAAADYFLNFPNDRSAYQEKLTNLTSPPRKRADFLARFRSFLAITLAGHPVQKTSCSPAPASKTELIVNKSSVLRIIRSYEALNCKVIKICFGFDECWNLQLIVSGTFHSPDGQFSPIDVDHYLGKKPIGAGQPKAIYYLNFGPRIAARRAAGLLNKFASIQAEPVDWEGDKTPLLGYLLDAATFRLFLEDDAYLGKAGRICIRFGINNDGKDASLSGRPKIMMLEFSALGNSQVTPFYMCNMSTKNDSDPGDCPPRDPCNLSKQ